MILVSQKVIERDTDLSAVGFAATCIELLAEGSKQNFEQYAASCCASCLRRFTDQSLSAVKKLRSALTAIYEATDLKGLENIIMEFLSTADLAVRSETITFLGICIARCSATKRIKISIKAFVKILVKESNISNPRLRSNCIAVIGTALAVLGEVLSFHLSGLNETTKREVRKASQKAVVRSKAIERPKAGAGDPKCVGQSVNKSATVMKELSSSSKSKSVESPPPPTECKLAEDVPGMRHVTNADRR